MKVADTWPRDVKDACGNFFGMLLRGLNPDLPADAHVLEIGCAEFDWLGRAEQAWPEMRLTGIDWRRAKTAASRATVIQGDVLQATFPPASFDWIVSVSALEHIGLGHYERDPICENGDTRAVAQAWAWLKPGGVLCFDVPWNSGKDAYQVVGTSHRVYDDAALQSRLFSQCPGYQVLHTAIAHKSATSKQVDDIPRLKGGEDFYYFGVWLRKAT